MIYDNYPINLPALGQHAVSCRCQRLGCRQIPGTGPHTCWLHTGKPSVRRHSWREFWVLDHASPAHISVSISHSVGGVTYRPSLSSAKLLSVNSMQLAVRQRLSLPTTARAVMGVSRGLYTALPSCNHAIQMWYIRSFAAVSKIGAGAKFWFPNPILDLCTLT